MTEIERDRLKRHFGELAEIGADSPQYRALQRELTRMLENEESILGDPVMEDSRCQFQRGRWAAIKDVKNNLRFKVGHPIEALKQAGLWDEESEQKDKETKGY